MLKLNSYGDTIVEVLIVLAVLGSALGISYATANRSLLGARQAQERSEALGYVQGQIELLRSFRNSTGTTDIFSQSGDFCIPNAQSENFATPDVAAGGDDPCLQGAFYHVSITYDSSQEKFIISAEWDDVRGSQPARISLDYRVFKDA